MKTQVIAKQDFAAIVPFRYNIAYSKMLRKQFWKLFVVKIV